MNWILTHKLRGWAAELRSAAPEDRAEMKPKFLEEFVGALLVSLGTPPTEFDWTYKDKDGKYCQVSGLTPLSFYNDLIKKSGFDFSEWISLINDPRNEYGKAYTVDRLGNVFGAPPVKYINVDIDTLKQVPTQPSHDNSAPHLERILVLDNSRLLVLSVHNDATQPG